MLETLLRHARENPWPRSGRRLAQDALAVGPLLATGRHRVDAIELGKQVVEIGHILYRKGARKSCAEHFQITLGQQANRNYPAVSH